MRLIQSFIIAPAHCSQISVQNAVSPQFRTKSVVRHIHHRGNFFRGIVHPQGFWGCFSCFHGLSLGFNAEKYGKNNVSAIIRYCFGTFRYHSVTFTYDFVYGANKTDILTCVKDIFSEKSSKKHEQFHQSSGTNLEISEYQHIHLRVRSNDAQSAT
jgi:hypothetical protein